MTRVRAKFTRICTRASREDGYILVVAVAMIAVGLLAAAAAFIAVTGTRADASRQQRSERALQAADAGVATELYRANQVDLTTMNLNGGISLAKVIGHLLTCPITVARLMPPFRFIVVRST